MSDPNRHLPEPVKPPGDISHLSRLLGEWSRAVFGEEGVSAAEGRLRRLVGVTVVARMLDGLQDDRDVERIGFKGDRRSNCASASGPAPRKTLMPPTGVNSLRDSISFGAAWLRVGMDLQPSSTNPKR